MQQKQAVLSTSTYTRHAAGSEFYSPHAVSPFHCAQDEIERSRCIDCTLCSLFTGGARRKVSVQPNGASCDKAAPNKSSNHGHVWIRCANEFTRPTSGLGWRSVCSQSLIGQQLVRGVAIGRLLRETWRMRTRQERGVIRYHWRLIPRLLQTKSDSMLDGGWQREGNKHK